MQNLNTSRKLSWKIEEATGPNHTTVKAKGYTHFWRNVKTKNKKIHLTKILTNNILFMDTHNDQQILNVNTYD